MPQNGHPATFECTCEQAIFEALRDAEFPLFLPQIASRASGWCHASYEVAMHRMVRRGIVLAHGRKPNLYRLPRPGFGRVTGSAASVRVASFRVEVPKVECGEAAAREVGRESAGAVAPRESAPWECELV